MQQRRRTGCVARREGDIEEGWMVSAGGKGWSGGGGKGLGGGWRALAIGRA
jgi:hypothetical protein